MFLYYFYTRKVKALASFQHCEYQITANLTASVQQLDAHAFPDNQEEEFEHNFIISIYSFLSCNNQRILNLQSVRSLLFSTQLCIRKVSRLSPDPTHLPRAGQITLTVFQQQCLHQRPRSRHGAVTNRRISIKAKITVPDSELTLRGLCAISLRSLGGPSAELDRTVDFVRTVSELLSDREREVTGP